jgi:hypothetical protein
MVHQRFFSGGLVVALKNRGNTLQALVPAADVGSWLFSGSFQGHFQEIVITGRQVDGQGQFG